jgi:hypothetical protein
MTAVSDLLDRAPVLQSVSADLRRNTWTFAMPERLPVRAGEYALVPLHELGAARQADEALAQNGVWLPPPAPSIDQPRHVHFHAGYGYHSYAVSIGDSYELSMQTEPLPDKSYKRGVWYGNEARLDSDGRRWTRSLPHMLMDDFGDLVEVPECS